MDRTSGGLQICRANISQILERNVAGVYGPLSHVFSQEINNDYRVARARVDTRGSRRSLARIPIDKMKIEEQFMTAQFGSEYTSYRQNTKALVPFLW